MCLSLHDHQLTIIVCCVLKMLYMNLMETVNQKPVIDTEKIKRNPSLTLKKLISHKGREQEKKRGTGKNFINNQKTKNKMAINIYLSVITLSVNGLSFSGKRHVITEWIKRKA